MITEKEFRASDKHIALRLLLNDPLLKEALEIVGDTARPRGVVEPKAGTHLDTLVAQRFHKQAGIQAALDHLRRLSEPPPSENQVEDELESIPFFSTLPPVVQQALRKKLHEQSTPE